MKFPMLTKVGLCETEIIIKILFRCCIVKEIPLLLYIWLGKLSHFTAGG